MKNKNNIKFAIEACHELAHLRGGFCLSSRYTHSRQLLLWKCCLGHIWEAVFYNVKRGTWCKTCSASKANDHRKLSIEECQLFAISKGGKCLSNIYPNSSSKLLWQCTKLDL